MTDWASLVTAYTYDGVNRLATASLPNGVISSYNYDDAGRVLEIRHESPAELLSSFEYSYDDVGNRVQAVETLRLPGAPSGDLFFDDGESGGGLWIAEWTWALADEAAYSGSLAWSDSPGADYLNGSNDSLTMAQPVQLPASPAARLIFWDPLLRWVVPHSCFGVYLTYPLYNVVNWADLVIRVRSPRTNRGIPRMQREPSAH